MRFKATRRGLVALALLALVGPIGSIGCAFGEFRPNDPFKREYSLEQAQKRYSDLVRWSKFKEASLFMERDARLAFEAKMPDFREIRFTEHQTEPWTLDEEMRATVVNVTYRGYSMSVPVEVEVHETQTWTREGKGNNWKVVSDFKDLDLLAGR